MSATTAEDREAGGADRAEDRETSDAEESATAIDLDRLAELYTLLSRCFEHPDEAFVAAVNDGSFEAAIEDRLGSLPAAIDPAPSLGDDRPAREAYLSTFESFDGAYASPIESVHEVWWDGTERGITDGPAAHDMRRRYEAIDAEVPDAYPPDHVSLLLEYGCLLFETGEIEAYRRFHREHFDWIPSFVAEIDRTSDSQFYRWAGWTLETVLDATQQQLKDHEQSG